jgi:hypothetical protein
MKQLRFPKNKLWPKILSKELRFTDKKVWISAAVIVSLAAVIWYAVWKNKNKPVTVAGVSAKLTGFKAKPDYTLLFLDTLNGFDPNEISTVDGVTKAPYLEAQADFAADAGMDGILISVPVDYVMQSDGTTNWDGVEHCLTYASQKGLFLIVKLNLFATRTYLYPDFNLSDYAGDSSIKFSSSFWDKYAPQIVRNYKAKFESWHLDGRILSVVPTSNRQQEWGYQDAGAGVEGSYANRVAQTVNRFNQLSDLLSPLDVMMDTGSAYDSLAANGRGTCALRDFKAKSFKMNPNYFYNAKFDVALGLTTAREKGGMYMVEWTNSPSGQVTANMTENVRTSIDAGVDIVGFAFVYDAAGQAVAREVISGLKTSGHYRRSPKTQWNPVGEMNYTTTELAANGGYEGAVLNRFSQLVTANGGKLPKVIVTNNL